MQQHSKYARIERERRFLLERLPQGIKVTRVRRITDRYINGTALRLRVQHEDNGPTVFKLTQKVPAPGNGAQQGLITSMYLTEEEFAVIAQLPARMLSKIRYSVPPFGIDVFEDTLQGLVLAEAEFQSGELADALVIPSFIRCEVSADSRFAGGHLVAASRQDLERWLSEYGIALT